ncbi:MAG: pirin family protein [Alphaproteobacteria bacterium]|nr:MAG: pirin family protein [Alphaproteobacteria bacterium]
MITIRDRNARGRTQTGWLDSRHTFSFGDYRDPDQMGFRSLRVINEDRVIPGAGFGTHGHRDMEIISYVVSGALEHKDSLGTGSVIRPGEVQRMSAGTGITHSEFNASKSEPVHFLQIWIVPERTGLAPGYEQKAFPAAARRGRMLLVGDRHGSDGALTIHQDVRLYAGLLHAGEALGHGLADGRHGWLQVVRGLVRLNGHELREGDGAAIVEEPAITLETEHGAELLLFDLK